MARKSIQFYDFELAAFLRYCRVRGIVATREVTPDFIRTFLLTLAETHNPGGVHGAFRILRVFFRWREAEEISPDGWKSPITRRRIPKVPV